MTLQTEDKILYLCREDVERVCAYIDGVALMRESFALHGVGETVLPDEAYLSWTNTNDESVRSLNMPAYIHSNPPAVGTKIINGNIANTSRGLPRASGITLLYDPMTTRITSIMEAACISSLRTACVSVLAINLVKGREITTAAIIGAGVLAQAHIRTLAKNLKEITTLFVYDIDLQRITSLQRDLALQPETSHLTIHRAATAEEAIRTAQLVIPTTTTTTGYIHASWLQSGSIFVNVSLDDPLPEVVFQAEKVIVDDWQLVKNDPRRLLGRMYRAGELCGPDDEVDTTGHRCRRVDAQLGELVLGKKTGRDTLDGCIFINPFGLAIEDIAFASRIYLIAKELGIGIWLPR
jgi:N-[(2S)-2-amino-2-carboxyethyl]-L-glutamate dehydrogenase